MGWVLLLILLAIVSRSARGCMGAIVSLVLGLLLIALGGALT